MKALFDFIISPDGDRYNNTVDVDGGSLITNTEIYSHQHTNRNGIVLSTPINNPTDIEVGDKVIVHHNVFRRYHDIRGEEKNGRAYFKEDQYFVRPDQIFLYKRDEEYKPLDGFCFVKPLSSIDDFDTNNERPLVGIIKHTSNKVKSFGISNGDLVGFTPYSEYEFVIDGERMYRVFEQEISIKHQKDGTEREYNPEWAKNS